MMSSDIGIDLVEVSRIDRAIKRWGDVFLNRIFDSTEIEYSYRHKNPAQHLAARFAAKEAVYKALNCRCRGLSWRQIVVENLNGRPICRVTHPDFHGCVSISLSHTQSHAVAMCVVPEFQS